MIFSLATAAAVSAFASTVHGFGMKPSAEPHVVEGFKWRYPFEEQDLAPYNRVCEAEQEFPAREYLLHDLSKAPPDGLLPWMEGLKEFFSGREYPGAWAGWDRHLHDRSIVIMEYADVPLHVKLWVEDQERSDGEGKGLFGVFEKPKGDEDKITSVIDVPPADKVERSGDGDKVMIFAPGALYPILPLWVADGSNCEATFLNIQKYGPRANESEVIAWPKHSKPNNKEGKRLTITVRAMALAATEKPAAPAAEARKKSGTETKPTEKAEGRDEL